MLLPHCSSQWTLHKELRIPCSTLVLSILCSECDPLVLGLDVPLSGYWLLNLETPCLGLACVANQVGHNRAILHPFLWKGLRVCVNEATNYLNGEHPLINHLLCLCCSSLALLSPNPLGCSQQESRCPLYVSMNNSWSDLVDMDQV